MATRSERTDAERAWKDFNKRSEIDFTSTISDPWPKSWTHVGTAKTTYYASDKWKPRGTMERYYHDHGKNVQVWVAGDMAKKLGFEPQRVRHNPEPPADKPKAAAILGSSLGVDIERPDGSKGKLMPDSGSVLVCSPDRKKLYVIEESTKGHPRIVAVIAGGALTVEQRGIVG